jgi:hypothetical protein
MVGIVIDNENPGLPLVLELESYVQSCLIEEFLKIGRPYPVMTAGRGKGSQRTPMDPVENCFSAYPAYTGYCTCRQRIPVNF